MKGPERFFRSSLLWRGAMIVALFVSLQSLLLKQRAELIQQEAAYGHAILDNAWAISELLNETKNLAARLNGYVAGRTDRDLVRLSFDVLWSRIDALIFAERIEFEGLEPLERDYRALLVAFEDPIFDDAPLAGDVAIEFIAGLDTLAQRTRQLWSVEFNQNRSQFLGRVSGEIAGTARDIDALIALVALAGLSYLGFELLLSNRALQREHALATEARSASEMKSSFLANMSHEVRTPLNGVIGAIDLLRDADLGTEQMHLVDTIASSAEHLLGVVNQVLDISKIEAGKVEIEHGVVDLAQTARIVLAMFDKAAADKGLTISCTLHPYLPPHVRGDALRLRQVLANLVSNAVKFTETGSITIEIGEETDPARGRLLTLRVVDTGIGISREAQTRVFDAFAQSDVSDTRRYGGTGLGLTISRQLVRLMDGDLKLRSRPGEGTEVTISLPLRPVRLFEPPAQLAMAAPAEGETAAAAPISVLIADDNRTNRMLLARMLARLVTTVREVEDGAAAVEAWSEGGVDLILMDVQMPVMSGPEAAATIRAAERQGGLRRVPIYSISANAMPHQIEAYASAGMDGHLSKPFRKVELAEIVLRHASDRRGDRLPMAAA
jgi:signal transduction histidine kinase/CheY-like chemotaxis protein